MTPRFMPQTLGSVMGQVLGTQWRREARDLHRSLQSHGRGRRPQTGLRGMCCPGLVMWVPSTGGQVVVQGQAALGVCGFHLSVPLFPHLLSGVTQ